MPVLPVRANRSLPAKSTNFSTARVRRVDSLPVARAARVEGVSAGAGGVAGSCAGAVVVSTISLTMVCERDEFSLRAVEPTARAALPAEMSSRARS